MVNYIVWIVECPQKNIKHQLKTKQKIIFSGHPIDCWVDALTQVGNWVNIEGVVSWVGYRVDRLNLMDNCFWIGEKFSGSLSECKIERFLSVCKFKWVAEWDY